MKRCLAYSLIATALCVSPVMAQAGGRGFPLQVASTTVVGEEAGFASIVAATVSPTGVVYVVDYMNCTVSAFSPEGRMLWRVGRKGQGPGEYQLPYRVASAPDGSVLIFDLATNDVTTLSRDGRFLGRVRLPFKFPYVDDMVATASELLISGYTPTGQARSHGIHRFRRNATGLAYAGSFAPLPTVRDTAIRRYWGAGDISRAGNVDLLYALNLPYLIYRYDGAGRQKAMIRPPIRVRGTPDDAVRIERNGRQTAISPGEEVDRPSTVIEVIGGRLLVSRITPRGSHWDAFASSGAYVGSREFPKDWGAAVGFDFARNILWMVGTRDDAPVLMRVQITLGTARSQARMR